MAVHHHIPNALTLLRILLIPITAAVLYLCAECWFLAMSLFLLAGISDFFDGWLARRWNVKSDFGRMLDPIADKLLVAAVLVVMIDLERLSGWNILPVVIILLREIMVSGLREFMAGREVTLHVTALAKWKTAFQLLAVGGLLIPPIDPVGLVLLWIAGGLTLITGWQYATAVLRALADS